MFEGLQQFLAAALRRAAAIGGDGHQHNRFPGQHPTDAMQHQAMVNAVALAAGAAEPLQLPLGHAWIVLQFQGAEGMAIAGLVAHAPDEEGFRR